METRRYGGTDFYWEFSGPFPGTKNKGKYYCNFYPNGCVSATREKDIQDFPKITEEEAILIRLSW